VREYTEEYYIPAASAYRKRAADGGVMGVQIVNWQRGLEQNWSNLRFGEMKVGSEAGEHLFELQIYLGGLDPNAIQVELYANGINGERPARQEMKRGQQLVGADGYIFSAHVSSARPARDYTVRIIPSFPGVTIPLEDPRILWQR
jgi:starch phosphorylase